MAILAREHRRVRRLVDLDARPRCDDIDFGCGDYTYKRDWIARRSSVQRACWKLENAARFEGNCPRGYAEASIRAVRWLRSLSQCEAAVTSLARREPWFLHHGRWLKSLSDASFIVRLADRDQ